MQQRWNKRWKEVYDSGQSCNIHVFLLSQIQQKVQNTQHLSLPLSLSLCIHWLSSPQSWLTSCLHFGKQKSYPDYNRFLPSSIPHSAAGSDGYMIFSGPTPTVTSMCIIQWGKGAGRAIWLNLETVFPWETLMVTWVWVGFQNEWCVKRLQIYVVFVDSVKQHINAQSFNRTSGGILMLWTLMLTSVILNKINRCLKT